MRTMLMVAVLVAAVAPAGAQQRLADQLRKGIVEEETSQNLDKAIQAYQSIITQYDEDRKAAGTALFRLAECYRKAGKREQAIAAYQRVTREFADQSAIAGPSRQNLATLGVTESSDRAGTSREQAVQAAQAKVKKAEERLDQVSKTYGPNHPEVVKARSALEAAQADLKAQMKRGATTGAREPERVAREVTPDRRESPREFAPERVPALAGASTSTLAQTRIEMQYVAQRLAEAQKKMEVGQATQADLRELEMQYQLLQNRYQRQVEEIALNRQMMLSVEKEIALVQEQIAAIEKSVKAGVVSAQDTELLQLRRDLLGLQRKLDELRASLKG